MARNSEKAQSMLFRFREAQQAEMGITVRGLRRPRMASACNSLRDAEKWRGEILRDISRKVGKIQDPALTDFEIRDLNDGINQLLREKSHWERQIVALGGANYRRAAVQMNDEGNEVPGTRGYKYFGRAKELPGVKQLFETTEEKKKLQREEDSYKPFQNNGPSYYGDLDEDSGELLAWEAEQEEEEWRAIYQSTLDELGLAQDIPEIPRKRQEPLSVKLAKLQELSQRVNEQEVPVDVASKKESLKFTKSARSSKRKATSSDAVESDELNIATGQTGTDAVKDPAKEPSSNIAATLDLLNPEDLKMYISPTKQEMEQVLLNIRKQALLKQFEQQA